MDNMIDLVIDGKNCKAKEGEFILNVARANGIFVPALCYQSKCSPTLACRVCLVEADGKQVYACNAKVKDGMKVTVTTPNIAKERRAIMEVYDINHPLQCGVCDQSGECELQNYTLYMKVDSQNYAIKDIDRPAQNWGLVKYDPGLCIVCEKCVTICKDMIGSGCLSTVKRGGDPLDKSYKDSMPKDAYSMWNKLNKSLIGVEEDKCIDCGECIAVCPVGALVSSDFQYKSNAWELTKIPASNPFSSDCALLYYEVKHDTISNNTENRIYRVTNEAHYAALNGAARFGFDFVNKASKDEEAFKNAVEAFRSAESIEFNSFITNEEAKILQLLKEKLGVKLVNKDAFRYNNFLKEYSKVTGKSLYNGVLDDIHHANFTISIGSFLKSDAPSAKYAFNNAIIMNKGAGLYFHPMGDKHIEGFGKKGKTIETVMNKPFSEDAILYFILEKFGKDLPEDIISFLDSQKETRTKTITETIKEEVIEIVKDEESGEEKEVKKMLPKKVQKEVEYQYTKLLDIIGTDESFLEVFETLLEKKDRFALIIGADCITQENCSNIAKLAAMVEKYTEFKVVIPPTQTNTLGISQICDLDVIATGKTVGYNVKADFELSALGDGDLDMPVLNQQEGTFTNINKKVVPTNAAIKYNGYTLNDIANEILDRKVEYTIDYTKEIFKGIAFDNLENHYSNDWSEHRGYTIDTNDVEIEDKAIEYSSKSLEIPQSEYIIYSANPINQFNEFTAVATQLKDGIVTLYMSQSVKEKLELQDDDQVEIVSNGNTIVLPYKVDNDLIGDISYVPTFDKKIDTKSLFDNCRFSTANLKRV